MSSNLNIILESDWYNLNDLLTVENGFQWVSGVRDVSWFRFKV